MGIRRARDFVAGPAAQRSFIGGSLVEPQGSGTIDVYNPATGERLNTIGAGAAADVNLAVIAAQKAFETSSWSAISPHERTRFLLAIADGIGAHADELAAISTLEMGMPYRISQYVTKSMVDVFRYYAGWPTKMFGSTNPSEPSVLSYTLREPLGVVGAIIPWNGPILYTCWKIAMALATGNTVVLKPAEQAPLTSLRVVQIIQEAGLPDGVVNVVQGLGTVAGAALVEHPGVAKITFTGSTAVGRQIMAAAAPRLKHVSLELGGKSPAVVFADADVERALASVLLGFTGNTGQACTAPTRIFVEKSIATEFSARLSTLAEGIVVGDPFDDSTQMGPLASEEQFDRVQRYIALARTEGAHAQTGGSRSGDTGFFIEPTVFSHVSPDMTIAREEIFGPVGVVIPFSDESDVLTAANDTDYGLAAAVWTTDLGKANRFIRGIKAGMVWVNTVFELDPVAPFGGYKQSGLGRELGAESIDDFTQMKSVVVRT